MYMYENVCVCMCMYVYICVCMCMYVYVCDRRERNSWEGRIPGPSAALPVGFLLSHLVIPEGCGIKLCVTDRSDYYHQVAVSFERRRTNAVWPPMKLEKIVELNACPYVERTASSRRPVDR